MNVLFDYQYRDVDNYKECEKETIFANPEGMTLDEADRRLRAACVDNDNFTAAQVGIAEVFPNPLHDDEPNHAYHEFLCLKGTMKAPTDRRTLVEFVQELEHEQCKGWDAKIPYRRLDQFGRRDRDALEARWRTEYEATVRSKTPPQEAHAPGTAPQPPAKPGRRNANPKQDGSGAARRRPRRQ